MRLLWSRLLCRASPLSACRWTPPPGRLARIGPGLPLRAASSSSSTAAFALESALAGLGLKGHHDIHKFSVEKVRSVPRTKMHARGGDVDVTPVSLSLSLQPDEFWGLVARHELRWARPFDRVMKCDMSTADFKWFLGGKLNAAGRRRG